MCNDKKLCQNFYCLAFLPDILGTESGECRQRWRHMGPVTWQVNTRSVSESPARAPGKDRLKLVLLPCAIWNVGSWTMTEEKKKKKKLKGEHSHTKKAGKGKNQEPMGCWGINLVPRFHSAGLESENVRDLGTRLLRNGISKKFVTKVVAVSYTDNVAS